MTVSSRWTTFSHALAFVIGFSLVFVALGASVAFFGYAINAYLPTFVKFGGVILILFGLQVTGVLGWLADRIRAAGRDQNPLARAYIAAVDGLGRLMYTEGRVQARVDRRWVGLPFLLTGLAFSSMTGVLRRLNRRLGLVSKITGIFLIAVGVLLFNDRLSLIANFFVARFGTGLASVELGGISSAVSIPIAFLGGLLSFLSPCVLPLIPAYIGYLSGAAVTSGAVAPARPAQDAAARATDGKLTA
ncbi:MAG: Cytochrome C biogenesis protein transmembrane region [Chloroflexi bacterium ADurb.Bin325]|nr:MAG: Cytochrome C biogenesis protein transmembrane region [Chloroflexi bacterium ADurb.Bin325]